MYWIGHYVIGLAVVPKLIYMLTNCVRLLTSYPFFFFGLFAFSRASPMAYGGSQARDLIRAVAACLHILINICALFFFVCVSLSLFLKKKTTLLLCKNLSTEKQNIIITSLYPLSSLNNYQLLASLTSSVLLPTFSHFHRLV